MYAIQGLHIRHSRLKTTPSFQALNTKRTIKSLVTHDETLDDPEIMNFFGEVYLELKSYYELQVEPNEVLQMFKRIWVNCQTICDDWEKPIATAIYLGQSALNHSCVIPREYTFTYQKATFLIKALKDVEVESPQDLDIPYICVLQSREFRQQSLSRWYFTCTCDICTGKVSEIMSDNHQNVYEEVLKKMRGIIRDEKTQSYLKHKFILLRQHIEKLSDVTAFDLTKFSILYSLAVEERLLKYTSDEREFTYKCLDELDEVYKKVYGEGYFLYDAFHKKAQLIKAEVDKLSPEY